jgi:E3 ubiquitin-protein transferase RMND5
MEALLADHARLENKGNLKKSIDDVQKIIDLLEAARESVITSKKILWRTTIFRRLIVCTDPAQAPIALAKLQQPVKRSFERLDSDMKDVYSALGKYGKGLDRV